MLNNGSDKPSLWARLVASAAVREQQVAFTCATSVPLALVPGTQAGHAEAEGAFCVKGCLGDPSGVLCSRRLLKAEKRAVSGSFAVQYCCPSGLVKILVPVFFGGRHVGSLLAGPFSTHSLDGARLKRLVAQLEKAGLGGRVEQLKTTWQFSPKLTPQQCRASGTLLRMFSKYLEEQLRENVPPPGAQRSTLLQKIESLLAQSNDDHISLKEVATRMSLSPCHFCAVFKKQTGVTFSQYRTRRRLEKARDLLTAGDTRVSDVAFEAGFGSIPYFNRAFRRHFGCSPSEFRTRLAERNPGQENLNPGVAPTAQIGFND